MIYRKGDKGINQSKIEKISTPNIFETPGINCFG